MALERLQVNVEGIYFVKLMLMPIRCILPVLPRCSVLLSRALQADKLAADLSGVDGRFGSQSGKIPVAIDE